MAVPDSLIPINCAISVNAVTLVATYSLFPVFLTKLYQLQMLWCIYEIKVW